MNIVLQPVGSLEAKEHYENTIFNPVKIDQYKGNINLIIC